MSTADPFSCKACGRTFRVEDIIKIDAVDAPELRDELISGRLDPRACPGCGAEPYPVPLAYWSDAYVAIVQGICPRATQDIGRVAELTQIVLTRTRPDRANLPTEVRLMGIIDQLVYMLKNPEDGNSCPFADLAVPNWNMQQTVLEELASVYLGEQRSDFAFSCYLSLLDYLPELLRIRKVRDDFELIAHVADKVWVAENKTGPTPIEQFDKLVKEFDSGPFEKEFIGGGYMVHHPLHLFETESQFGEFELRWCTPGPGFEDAGNDGRELSYLVPSTFVEQPMPSQFKQALAWLILLMQSSVLMQHGFGEGWVKMQHGILVQQLVLRWRELSDYSKEQLSDIYNSLTGASLVVDLRLSDELG